MKKFLKILVGIILVAVLVGVIVGIYFIVAGQKSKSTAQRAKIETDKPQCESVLTLSAEDFETEIEYALYLYNTACAAFQNCEKAAIVEDYTTKTDIGGMIEVPCQGCRFTIKSGTEYYYADYSGTEKDYEIFLKGKNMERTLFAIRSYVDIAEMDYLYSEKVLKPTVEIKEKNFHIEADWSEDNRANGYPKHDKVPVFCAEQEGTFEQTEQTISLETVTSATVTYDAEKEYYTVKFVLDADNPKTTEKTIENLQAGLSGGYYTSIKKTYQIWDNGYFRYCNSKDQATNGAFSLDLSFISYFKYKDEDCNPANYQYLEDAKKNALAEIY